MSQKASGASCAQRAGEPVAIDRQSVSVQYRSLATLNVHQVDARQIHQQAVFVNQDRSAEVAEIAELRHQALLAEQGQPFVESRKVGSIGML